MFPGSNLGKCVGMPAEFFYPQAPLHKGGSERHLPKEERTTQENLEQESADFCRGVGIHLGTGECKVLSACEEYAIVSEGDGVLGGLTSFQRIKIRRSKKVSLQRPEIPIMDDLAMTNVR